MYGSGATRTISVSRGLLLARRRRAVYMPTQPPPTMRMRAGALPEVVSRDFEAFTFP
ncbi:hypothetical protein P405_31690 [Streptomyces sp. FR-008]|nr:hypothetical protein P405_31690 [Streptomyces sp. FR-008]